MTDISHADLITLLEAAPEGSRDLDSIIDWAIDWETQDYCELPRYSTSIDAAMTLIPTFDDGNRWFHTVECYANGKGNASIIVPSSTFGQIWARQQSTPAIAICVAALKAHTHE